MQLMNRSILSAIEPKIEGIMAGLPMYQNVQEIDEYAAWPLNTTPPMFHWLFVLAPQNGSMFTLLFGLGVALVVIALCLIVERYAGRLLKPFAACGHCALTLYALQFLVAWALTLCRVPFDSFNFPGWDLVIAIIVTLLGCVLYNKSYGVFENGMKKFSTLFS